MYAGCMTTDAAPHTVFPPDDLGPLDDLSLFLEQSPQPAALLGPDGQQVPLPMEAYRILLDVVTAMRQGQAITIAPQEQQLTTQQAADHLGISRPTLVQLLESGQLPFTKLPGSRHRRVLLRDILRYQQDMRLARKATLDQLTAEAQSDGLLDEPAADYRTALRKTRHSKHTES